MKGGKRVLFATLGVAAAGLTLFLGRAEWFGHSRPMHVRNTVVYAAGGKRLSDPFAGAVRRPHDSLKTLLEPARRRSCRSPNLWQRLLGWIEPTALADPTCTNAAPPNDCLGNGWANASILPCYGVCSGNMSTTENTGLSADYNSGYQYAAGCTGADCTGIGYCSTQICTARCTSNANCQGSTPICNMSGGTWGTCVPCTAGACTTAPYLVCSAGGACVQCDSDHTCSGCQTCNSSGNCQDNSTWCFVYVCDDDPDCCLTCTSGSCTDGGLCPDGETCDADGYCEGGCDEGDCYSEGNGDEESGNDCECEGCSDCESDFCNAGKCGSDDPIIVDLTGAGFALTNARNGVKFDFFGTGKPIQMPWTAVGSSSGWLALDRKGNGLISNGADLFSNVAPQPDSPTRAKLGFRALAVYDLPANGGNGDGIIDQRDAVFSKLLVWVDKNHNGISEPGELLTMQQAGIRSISLHYALSRWTDAYGNQFRYRSQITFVGGGPAGDRYVYDVMLGQGSAPTQLK